MSPDKLVFSSASLKTLARVLCQGCLRKLIASGREFRPNADLCKDCKPMFIHERELV